MADLTILHVSDLHWSKAKANDQRIVVDAFLEDIRRLKGEQLIPDIVIFSGDLVQSGDEFESFASVKEHFIDRLVRETAPAPLIIIPGNHDIQREVVRATGGFIEAGLKANLNNVDRVNSLIDDVFTGKGATAAALERMSNFEKAYGTFGCPSTICSTPLLKTYKLDVRGTSVGIANFNTAWRATGEPDDVDRHFLLLGERHVDHAIEDLTACDVRIAVFHHPLDWLADFDNVAVSSRLLAEFDILCNGHTHASEPQKKISAIGSAIISQTGCLYQHRDYFNGYQFLKMRLDDGEVDFHVRTYFNRPRRKFDKAVNVAEDGNVTLSYNGRSTPSSGPVAKFLRVARPLVRQAAADQVNIVEAVSDLRLDPKEAFICPPLTTRRSASLGVHSTAEDLIPPEEILRNSSNYLIVGPRECGKSTLAHYLSVLIAEGTIDRPRIPAVIDFRHLKLNTYGLARAISNYFGTAKEGLDIEDRLANGDFLIIVDSFNGRDKPSRDAFGDLVRKYPSCRWVLMADSRSDENAVLEHEDDVVANFRPVHIQSLPRKSIRELSRRWCQQAGIDNQKAFSAVMDQLRDGNLPRTGYMVTLLLWALYQERQFERINEALLLTYVVDHLLGKADFTQALQKNFDPTSKEITLQYLASVLRSSDGLSPKNDILMALIQFFKQKGLSYDASEVLTKLISCGLLRDNEGVISFKYRCFEEYFYAGLMRNDADKFKEATTGRQFVQFARELELLAGLRRQNKDILLIISNEMEAGKPDELSKYPTSSFDDVAAAETGGGLTRRRLEDIKRKKLTADQIDDLMDEVDREAKGHNQRNRSEEKSQRGLKSDQEAADSLGEAGASKNAEPPMSPFEYVWSIEILGKVTRNSEFTDAEDKFAATKAHINSSIQVMLLYVDIIKRLLERLTEEKEGGATLSKDEAGAARYLLLKAFVFGTSMNITEQIGTEKLFPIFESVYNDGASTTAERLMVAIMMLDLNHSKWLAYWERLIVEVKGKRFILDLLMDRLYHLIHVRPLSEVERKRVEAAAERIETEFGGNKQQRNIIVQTIRDVAKQTTRAEDK